MPIIIFPNDNDSVTFVYPASDELSVHDIARKDVPEGKPYLIVPDNLVPTDHTFFEAFEADFSNPDGYGIGHQNWFAEKSRNSQNNDDIFDRNFAHDTSVQDHRETT